jgi:2-hydroxychromene-2-carboxylate isomerase
MTNDKKISVEFYFDYSCPWTYLGYKRLIQTTTRTASLIVWKPINLEIVSEGLNKPKKESPKYITNYKKKDLQDWASYCSLDIKEHNNLDHRVSLKASRGAFFALSEGKIVDYSSEVFKAFFTDLADISDDLVLINIAEKLDMDLEGFKESIENDLQDEKIKSNSEELISKGGYGSPTMIVDNQLFFGNDRMNLVEFAIGQASGKVLVLPGQHDA